MKWTKDDIAKLRSLAKTMTAPKIAEAMDIPFNVVRWQLRKSGIKTEVPWKRPLKEQRAIIEYTKRNGMTETSKHFRITKTTIKNIQRRFKARIQRDVIENKQMEPVTLWRRAILVAAREGLRAEAQDFGSWAVTQYLSGRQMDDLHTRLIDYKREIWGNTRTSTGQREQIANRHWVPITESADTEQGVQISSPDKPGLTAMKVMLADAGITQTERIILWLQFIYGLEQQEIAEILDLSAARVSQMAYEARNKIKKKIEESEDENGYEDIFRVCPGDARRMRKSATHSSHNVPFNQSISDSHGPGNQTSGSKEERKSAL